MPPDRIRIISIFQCTGSHGFRSGCTSSAIKGHVPFLHFFDGFRTSHEIQKVDCLDYEDLKNLVDWEELDKFRKNALNPEHPVLRTTGQYSDTYFQSREVCNTWYDALPDVVEEYMNKINELTGRDYKPFNYYGAPDAEHVIVVMVPQADVSVRPWTTY